MSEKHLRELPVLDREGFRVRSHLDDARPLSPSRAEKIAPSRKPDWLRIRPPGGDSYLRIKKMLRERKLHTVCEEAHCPNVSECWEGGTATFMLGSDICTRACRFCAVKTSRNPPPLDPSEPAHVAQSVVDLGLNYVVLTSVDRDDLRDGGAGHFAQTIREIKARDSSILVEALVPDFRGDEEAVETVVSSGVDVYAHNIETVERLQARVRDPRASYSQSLETLKLARRYGLTKNGKRVDRLFTKSSIMLGLGEEEAELVDAFRDLRENGVDVLTLGQYLRPSLKHLPVERFVSPETFKELGHQAEEVGFLYVASGPMVRSSYRAGELFIESRVRRGVDSQRN